MSLRVNINLGQCREFSESVFGQPFKFSNVIIMRRLGKNILSVSKGLAASDRHKEKKKKRKEEKNNKQNKMHALVLDVCQGPLSWDVQARRARAEGEHAYL